MTIKVKIVGKTVPLIEGVSSLGDFIAYQARTSNPKSQTEGKNNKQLIDYLKRNRHWSTFDMVNIQIEIEAPRDISRQVLRHSSAKFQEFSQRYAEVTPDMFVVRELRRQDDKNRQNSIDDFSQEEKHRFENDCLWLIEECKTLYNYWIEQGAAKECARVFLPEGLTMSRLYMNGTVRTWMHYLDVREGNGTQKEHQEVATLIRQTLHEEEPDLF